MLELGNALGRFVGGLSDIDELRREFREFLRQHPDQREAVAQWLEEGIKIGKFAPAVLLTVGDLVGLTSVDVAARNGTAAPASRHPASIAPGWGGDADKTGVRDAMGQVAAVPERDAPLEVGTVLDARYTLVEQLGSGGMGKVFKARDRNRELFQDHHRLFIALKLLSEEFRQHPDARMALQRETVRAQSLAHPNVVTVYDFNYDGLYAYMTMELLEGETLDAWLQSGEPESATAARRWLIVRSIGAGLAYAHERGVVHSDLKPANVFLCSNGVVKVMDFGIARPLTGVAGQTSATLFDPGERLGALTPAYAALEQWLHLPPDQRDDIYSFACIVYEIYSGQHPYGRASAKAAYESHLVPSRVEHLTHRQWEALRHGLALRRQDRIATVDEFLRQFAPRTWLQRHRLWLSAAALLIVVMALLFGGQWYRVYVEDQAANQQLWPPAQAARAPLTADQQQDIADYLYLAQLGVHQAANTRIVEDLAAILSDGDNNVHQMLLRVRTLDPSNPDALRLTNEAARICESNARTLLASNRLKDALRLVHEGQKFAHSLGLFRVKRQLCSRDPTLCAGG